MKRIFVLILLSILMLSIFSCEMLDPLFQPNHRHGHREHKSEGRPPRSHDNRH